MVANELVVCGCVVQIDNSGVGHNWRNATEDNCPPSVQEEIAAEILDGKREEGQIISGGVHYRWS